VTSDDLSTIELLTGSADYLIHKSQCDGGPLFRQPMSRRRWVGLAGSIVIPSWWMATWWWYLNIL